MGGEAPHSGTHAVFTGRGNPKRLISGEDRMRIVRPLMALLIVVLLAACADSPTGAGNPETRVGNAGELRTDYILDPVVVVGTPRCDPYLDLNWCQDDGDGGSGDCMTSSTPDSGEYAIASTCPGAGDGTTKPGGGTAPPPSPGDDGICTAEENGTVCEDRDRPECERRPDAPGECVTRPPNPTEWDKLGQKIERMTENTEYCRAAKAIAREMYAAGREGGRIMLWDGRNYEPGSNQQKMVWGKNSSDSRGRIIEMDSHLAFNVHSLLAHEALHAYLSSISWQGTVDEQENWVRAREAECAG